MNLTIKYFYSSGLTDSIESVMVGNFQIFIDGMLVREQHYNDD